MNRPARARGLLPAAHTVVGWDVGGAHLKAALWRDGALHAARQWPCALWQGLDRLAGALAEAQDWLATLGVAARTGSGAQPAVPGLAQAVTMTGEMVDLFTDRAQGVAALVQQIDAALGPATLYYAGAQGWHDGATAVRRWQEVASANWHATAAWLALRLATHEAAVMGMAPPFPDGAALLVDIGSTTTDLIAVRGARVLGSSRSDADRLRSGELVYLGVARTALMALAPRLPFEGRDTNVMNEHFATTADVFRLLGELDPAHDQHASADGGAKDEAATCRRLARMIGRDADEATPVQWRSLASAWRAGLLERLRDNAERVLALNGLGPAVAVLGAGAAAEAGATLREDPEQKPPQAPLVAAGCGAFLVPDLARLMQHRSIGLAELLAPALAPGAAAAADWAQVCAPAVAVAALRAAA